VTRGGGGGKLEAHPRRLHPPRPHPPSRASPPVYSAFFASVASHHGPPLHLVRDLWWTAASVRSRAGAFLAYRRAAAALDAGLDDAGEADVARCGGVCIVCRDEMEVGGGDGGGGARARAKVLPCGHAFHVRCLRSWLERQQACPICRAPVLPQAAARPAPAAPPAAAPGAPPQQPPPAAAVPPPAPGGAGLHRRREWGAAPAAARGAAPAAAPAPPAPAAAIFLPAGMALNGLPGLAALGGGGGLPVLQLPWTLGADAAALGADPAVAAQLAELAALLSRQYGEGVAAAEPAPAAEPATPAAEPAPAAAAPPAAEPAPPAGDGDGAVRAARLARFEGAAQG